MEVLNAINCPYLIENQSFCYKSYGLGVGTKLPFNEFTGVQKVSTSDEF